MDWVAFSVYQFIDRRSAIKILQCLQPSCDLCIQLCDRGLRDLIEHKVFKRTDFDCPITPKVISDWRNLIRAYPQAVNFTEYSRGHRRHYIADSAAKSNRRQNYAERAGDLSHSVTLR